MIDQETQRAIAELKRTMEQAIQRLTQENAKLASENAELATRLANFRIDGANGIGDQGISLPDPPQNTNTGGIWRSFTDCDGDTFDVWTKNFTPP